MTEEDLNRSYPLALRTAGAIVHNYEEFGSCQGDWWADVTYNGQRFFITDYYGSCSGCDAFQNAFEWDADKKPDYQEKLAAFGREFLEKPLTFEQALTEASRNLSWDHDAEEMVRWIKNQRPA